MQITDNLLEENSQDGPNDVKTLKWDAKLIKKFWDFQSGFPENYFTNQYGEQISNLIFKLLPKNCRLVDYGCGTGALTKQFLNKNLVIASTDLSPSSLKIVNEKFCGDKNFLGAFSPENLANSELKFNAAILIEIVEHLEDEQLHDTLSYIHRILEPDGVLIISCPNNENLQNEIVYCPCCNHTFHRWQHVRSWSAESLTETLYKNGFSRAKVIKTNFSLANKDNRLGYFLKKIIAFINKKTAQPHLVITVKKCQLKPKLN